MLAFYSLPSRLMPFEQAAHEKVSTLNVQLMG